MYHDNGIDPEGLLSTLPAIAHVLIGFLVGRMLFRKHDGVRPAPSSPAFPLTELFVVGALLTFSGLLLDYGLPINKKVWSPTFVLATCGLASTLLGLLIYVIDIRGYKRWSRFFEVFGVNPLFLYALSGVLGILLGCIRVPMGEGTMSLHGIVYSKCLVPFLGDTAGSLAYALLFILLNWSIGYILYRRHIYIKL
jgi:predicted acyltransferase